MDAVRLQRVSELFDAARQKPESEREAFLRAACDDAFVRDEVESLLRHHSANGAPLNEPLLGATDAAAALMNLEQQRVAPRAERIGQYRILRSLGEGGMGAVFLAEQDRPRRTVALKVIRAGLASPRMLRRFEFEASVLGMLNHPGIAQIYEAGVHDDGSGMRPYFAMEYVEGSTLTAYAQAKALGTRQRLELVAWICDAVQHAHQRGVIHRDLKPGNILVDQAGQPKVLDFGVARATDNDLQVTTIQTDMGQLIGTLPYMSPEQVSGDARRLDMRSDVYSLGVLLYELLSGRLPHDLRGKTIAEAARVIGEEDPTPLSSIDRVFRGDLHTIVSRALVKDKERRYASAAELAADIRRFLRDEPIEAKRDSMTYLLRRRLKRYRVAVAAGVLFFVGVSAFAIYATIQAEEQARLALRESDARLAAEEAGRLAAEAERSASHQRDEARKARDAEADRSRQAQAVTAFLVNTLGITNPDVGQTADLSKEMMLAKASQDVADAFPGQPEAEATVRAVIGKAYAALGDPEPAAHHLWRAYRILRSLPQRDLDAEYDVFWPYTEALDELEDPSLTRQKNEARDLAIEIVARRVPDIREPANSMFALLTNRTDAAQVTAAYRSILESAERELAPDDPVWTPLADLLHQAAQRMRRRDMPALGHEALQTALGIHRRLLGETNTRVVRLLADLMDERLTARKADEAAALAEQTLQSLSQVLPEDHWYIALMRFRLGECLASMGKRAEAQTLMEAAAERIIENRGLSSETATTCLRTLLRFHEQGDDSQKIADCRLQFAQSRAGCIRITVSTVFREVTGPGFEPLHEAWNALQTAVTRRSPELAERVDAFFATWRDSFPIDDVRSAGIADFLTAMSERLMNTQGEAGAAIASTMLHQAADIDDALNLRHPRRRALTLWWLARVAELQKDFIEGERWALAAINVLETGPTERFGFIANAQSVLGGCLAGQGRFEDAEPMLLKGYIGTRDDIGPHDMNTTIALERLVDAYEAWGKPEQTLEWRTTAIERELARTPADATALNRVAWRVVVRSGLQVEAYQVALAAAAKAVDLAPRNAAYLNTRGVAEYRCGRLDQAKESLTQSNERSGGGSFEDIAFLALVNRALGDGDAAQASRSRLDALEPAPTESVAKERAMLRAEVDRAFADAPRVSNDG